MIFKVDPATRQLERLDQKDCTTGPNHGGCLSVSKKNGRTFFVCTSETGEVEQHALLPAGPRGVKTEKVRTLSIGKCEGAVADA